MFFLCLCGGRQLYHSYIYTILAWKKKRTEWHVWFLFLLPFHDDDSRVEVCIAIARILEFFVFFLDSLVLLRSFFFFVILTNDANEMAG